MGSGVQKGMPMGKIFNVNGACRPDRHYMVNLEKRLEEIRRMIEEGQYFTINKARQYGKTTLLRALVGYLKKDYVIISLDFQNIESDEFSDGSSFVHAFSREINKKIRRMPEVDREIKEKLTKLADTTYQNVRMAEMFECFSEWCGLSTKPVVLVIDEVDTAANNQVFLDFLAQLRAGYLDSDVTPTFQSVILAGVYDIRNINRKIRSEDEHKTNSPWNIAADFLVDMSFSEKDISGMLKEYEADYQTGMDLKEMAGLLYSYTSGYPYLVSRLCKFMDERVVNRNNFPDRSSAWTKAGFLEAVKMLLEDQNPLFESLISKLNDFSELNQIISNLLFQGKKIAYNPDDKAIQNARMFGFVKVVNSEVLLANRIFETRLYNYFLLRFSEQSRDIYSESARQKSQFIVGGHLNMRKILEKFVEVFDYLYGDQDETFLEDAGRKYFMLFLKPIINGTGNCYVEPETRNRERMDLVIDYHGEQHICELKIWHGNSYNERGERQLLDYMEYFALKKGYMLSFNFNKRKQIGVRDIVFGDRLLIEAVV